MRGWLTRRPNIDRREWSRRARSTATGSMGNQHGNSVVSTVRHLSHENRAHSLKSAARRRLGRNRRAPLFAAVIALCAILAGSLVPATVAAQQPQPKLTITQLDASAYPQLRAVVTALDANGVPVRGLMPAQFQAADGDTALTIQSAQGAVDQNLGLSVVLVIDISGSMNDGGAI